MSTLRITLFFLLLFQPFYSSPSFAETELHVSEMVHDFGLVQLQNPPDYRFTIQNRGEKTVHIQRVRSFCGCTVAELSSKDIPPGKEAFLEVKIDPQQLPLGDFSKKVDLFLSTGEMFTLTLKGKVEGLYDPETSPLLEVTPSRVNLGLIKKGESKTFRLYFKNKGKGELKIFSISGWNNKKEGQSPLTIPVGKKFEGEFVYKGTDVGSIGAALFIHSNDPKTPVVIIDIKGGVYDEKP